MLNKPITKTLPAKISGFKVALCQLFYIILMCVVIISVSLCLCMMCSLMPDKTMSLPMTGRMVPLSPAESLSPHEHFSHHGTGE